MNSVSGIGCQPLLRQNALKTVSFGNDYDDKKVKDYEDDDFESKTKDIDEDEDVKISKKDKPKINVTNAMKNFGQGLISPVTETFSSVANVAKTAGCVAILGALIKLKKEIAPLLTVAGLGVGAFQLTKGIHKAVTEKDVKEKENAFKDIGEGVATTGLSMLTARPFLKEAGVEKIGEVALENTGIIRATAQCVKDTPKFAKESIKAFDKIENLFKVASAGKEGQTAAITADVVADESTISQNTVAKVLLGSTGNEAVNDK